MIDHMELFRILGRERDSDALVSLPGDFAQQVSDYVDRLDHALRTAESYRDRDLLSDELRSVRIMLEQLSEIRLGKLIQYAACNVVAPDHMTTAEHDAYQIIQGAVRSGAEMVYRSFGVSE